MVERLCDFIERDSQMSLKQLSAARVVWGLCALYATSILLDQYSDARSGQFFNLPLLDLFPNVPDVVHRGILYTMFGLSVLMIAGKFAGPAALGISLGFVYILLSDHFGFRHVWVVQANLHFLLSILLLRRPIRLVPVYSDRSEPCLQQYALFALRAYVCLVYLIAALPKLNTGFLSGLVVQRLVTNWEAEGPLRSCLDAIPYAYAVMATLSCVIEVLLAIGLLVPRLRPVALLVGLLFHTAVPLIGWVGHSLNLYFVATYLFFAWNPNRPRTSIHYGGNHRGCRLAHRLDRLDNVCWHQDASLPEPYLEHGGARSSRPVRIAWVLITQVLYLNPMFLWYGAVFILMAAMKYRESASYALIFWLTLVVVVWEIVRLIRARSEWDAPRPLAWQQAAGV